MLKAVLFDLDGTLLPMDEDKFTKKYFAKMCEKLLPYGYNSDELIKAIWTGTKAMVNNNSENSNETVFWKTFAEIFGEKSLQHKDVFDDFYANEFETVKSECGYTPKAKETVAVLKNMGLKIAIASNPVFPMSAMESRIKWAGLEPSEFEFITAYENVNRCKPNPDYYKLIAGRLNVLENECVMTGNNVTEDMAAKNAGMNVFLLTDCLINNDRENINAYPRGSFNELVYYIKRSFSK